MIIYFQLLVFDYDEMPKVSPKKAMYSSMQMASPCVRAHVKTTKNLFQVSMEAILYLFIPLFFWFADYSIAEFWLMQFIESFEFSKL